MPGPDGVMVWGNEWIDYEKTYLRIPVGSDGWYSIGLESLALAGWPEDQIRGEDLVLFHNGMQVPIQTSTEGPFSKSDQLYFYGRKNRTDLEKVLFHDPEHQMLNPAYSLFTDTSVYFLTVSPGASSSRYRERSVSGQTETVSHIQIDTTIVFHGQFYTQATQGIIDPDFNDLEGFATAFARSVSREIDLSGWQMSGDSVYLEIGVGCDLNTRQFSISINGNTTLEFSNPQVQSARTVQVALPVNEITSTIEISLQGKAENNRVALSYVKVSMEMEAEHFLDSPNGRFRIKAEGMTHRLALPANANPAPIYNLRRGTYFLSNASGSSAEYNLEGGVEDEFSVFKNPYPVQNVSRVVFEDYLQKDFDYLIITSDFFMVDSSQSNHIYEYASYRNSEAGGSFRTGVVSIEQLRDQYVYGIEGHPYAIRNFVSQLIESDLSVRFVNIIGKGMGYGYLRSAADYQRYHYRSHFVPTFGHYGSDNLLMASKDQSVPRIPVGRIPVTRVEEIGFYLEKVRTYESTLRQPDQNEDRTWMKRVMHFNGGDRNIYSTISNFMDNLGNEMQRDSFAAQLISYYKSSFGSAEVPERDEIFSYINEGAALITFFGHSASSSLDFNIDIIEEYGNEGRLPVFLALGCSSGNIFLPGKNLAEKFILTPDVGSILFLSTATSQYLSNLQNLARHFYREFGSDQYGAPLGSIVRKTLSDLGRFQKHLQAVFVFAGDPAIQSYHFGGPDFTFDPGSVRLSPVRPSLVDDNFVLEVDVRNQGLLYTDTFSVLVRQQFPDGSLRTLDTMDIHVDGFDQTLEIRVPVSDNMEGKNTFFLTIDPFGEITEFPAGSGKSNNELEQNGSPGYDVFVQNTTLQLIYPYDQAIIPDQRPILEIFNGNIESDTRNYVIQLDTTPYFDSPGQRSFNHSSRQARILVPLEMDLEEEVVYYWRARWAQDSVFTPPKSFVYLTGRTGWNQSHYGQFLLDSLSGISIENSKMDFGRLQNVYKLDHGHKKADNLFNEIHRPRFFRTANPALNVSIFKPRENTWVRNTKPGLHGSIWPVASDDYLFTFVYRPYSQPHREAVLELIETEAEEGDYILFWNTTLGGNSPKGETWALDSIDNQGVNLFNYFEKQGATQIRALEEEDRRAYSLIYRKGGEVVTEILGDSAGINVEYVNLYSFGDRGTTWSGGIKLLKSLESWETGVEPSGADTVTMSLQVGTKTVESFFDRTSARTQTGSLEGVENEVFSWETSVRDIESRTFPSFFRRVIGLFRPDWRLTNLPETPLVDTAALHDNQLSVHFKVAAVGNPETDSIPVLVELFNGTRTWTRRISVAAEQWDKDLHQSWTIPSELNGAAVLKLTVDPDNDWLEAEENNNAIFRNFDIRGDRIAPAVNVLFDQLTILNGDIVAPNALITVEMSDFPNENLSTEPDFEFEIQKPSGALIKIEKNHPDLTLHTTDEGVELRYQSDFDENGLYELRVRVRDELGNVQATDYLIDFEVILENSVSEILPYPNPFVDAVRFAYTLTGRDEPEVFRIMIYTPSGRLVKEITKAEFGPMRIGRHLSEYVWNGRDNWNQDLAPGVYLYKVISRDSTGEDFEKFQIGELQEGNYFKNGIGKMVKLR